MNKYLFIIIKKYTKHHGEVMWTNFFYFIIVFFVVVVVVVVLLLPFSFFPFFQHGIIISELNLHSSVVLYILYIYVFFQIDFIGGFDKFGKLGVDCHSRSSKGKYNSFLAVNQVCIKKATSKYDTMK